MSDEKLHGMPLEAFIAPEQDGDGLHPNAEMLPLLQNAEVIIGRDVMTGHEFIVYGREVLQRIQNQGHDEGLGDDQMLCVEIDQETDELERLCAVVQVVKGRHEYQP